MAVVAIMGPSFLISFSILTLTSLWRNADVVLTWLPCDALSFHNNFELIHNPKTDQTYKLNNNEIHVTKKTSKYFLATNNK